MTLIAINRELSGLGNRVKFTLSMAAVAERVEADLDVWWPVDEHFGAEPHDLWENVPGRFISRSEAKAYSPPVLMAAEDLREETWSRESSIAVRWFTTVVQPQGSRSWGELLRELVLAEKVRKLVHDTWSQLQVENGVLGVSMRVHEMSHPKTKEHSPAEWYFDEIARVVAEKPDIAIFVSCDVPSVTEEVLSRFSTARAVPIVSDYNSRDSVQKSVADLYLLASCSTILTPYWSSFPELAYELSAGASPQRNSVSVRRAVSMQETVASDPVNPYHSRLPVG